MTKRTTARSPYDRMHRAIVRGSQRRRWLIPAVLMGLLVGGVSWVFNGNQPEPFEAATIILLHASLGLCTFLLAVLALDSLGFTDKETKLVAVGMKFLQDENFPDRMLQAIDARAEIGSSAGQIRTLFPLLVLPIFISLIGLELNLSTSTGALIAMLLVLPMTGFFKELNRANTDVIIRHAIAEHRCFQKGTQEANALLEQLLAPPHPTVVKNRQNGNQRADEPDLARDALT